MHGDAVEMRSIKPRGKRGGDGETEKREETKQTHKNDLCLRVES